MTDHPIIFSGPMVRALLDGRKTQTRRVIKLPTKGEYIRPDMGGWEATTVGGGSSFTIKRDGTRVPAREMVAIWNRTTGTVIAARYQVGDRLWVRENFAHVGTTDPGFLTFQATYPDDLSRLGLENVPATLKEAGYKWRPSIHMPRTLSRITLVVTAVKIEPLKDISETDAFAEGCREPEFRLSVRVGNKGHDYSIPLSFRGAFANLWSRLHGGDAWPENPWVCVPTFRVVRANIDATEAERAA